MSKQELQVDLQSEAKNIVLEEMEKMGFISKMKAQIKSQVLKILEKQKKTIKQNLEFDYMTALQKQSNKSKEIMMAIFLIKEFLQFYEFEYTLPILENESNIREKIKRETLINDFQLSSNVEGKPVLVQILTNYLNDMNNKKEGHMGDSYLVKQNVERSEEEIKHDPISLAQGKKILTPLNFANKSLDMKNENSPKNKDDSMKFNTANLIDIYAIPNKSPRSDGYSPEIKMKEVIYHNPKYDDEFDEVVLEELDHIPDRKKDELEDSKKGSSSMISMGYDSSVTNYKLDEFDHVEDVESVGKSI